MVFSVKLNLENFVTYLKVFVNTAENEDFEIVWSVELGRAVIVNKEAGEFTEIHVKLIRKT